VSREHPKPPWPGYAVWTFGFILTLLAGAISGVRYALGEGEEPFLVLALLSMGVAGMHLGALLVRSSLP
jgi:hypothetical protein